MNAVTPSSPKLPSLGQVGKALFYLGVAGVVGGELLTWRVAPVALGQAVWFVGILLEVGSAIAGFWDYRGKGGPKSGGDLPPKNPDGYISVEERIKSLVATPLSDAEAEAAARLKQLQNS